MIKVATHDIGERQGIVTLEAEDMGEVMSTDARRLAIKVAQQQGLTRPGLSGTESAYPVDANGETSDDLVMGRSGTVTAYRCDYRLTGGL